MSCTLKTQFFRMQKFQVQRLQICQQTTSIAFAYPLIKEQDEKELYNQKMKENFKNQNMVKEAEANNFKTSKEMLFLIASVGCSQ